MMTTRIRLDMLGVVTVLALGGAALALDGKGREGAGHGREQGEEADIQGIAFVPVDEEGALSITMEGKNMGILIGKRGQTLDSLQYLTNRVANKMQDGYVRVKLDTEDYRRRRKETLENLAKNIASKVKRTRRTVALEPMNPYERRIIHSALQSDPAVSTHSEGEEPYRKVVVTLARRSGGSHNYEKYDK